VGCSTCSGDCHIHWCESRLKSFRVRTRIKEDAHAHIRNNMCCCADNNTSAHIPDRIQSNSQSKGRNDAIGLSCAPMCVTCAHNMPPGTPTTRNPDGATHSEPVTPTISDPVRSHRQRARIPTTTTREPSEPAVTPTMSDPLVLEIRPLSCVPHSRVGYTLESEAYQLCCYINIQSTEYAT